MLLCVTGGSHGCRFDYTFEYRKNAILLGSDPATTLAFVSCTAFGGRGLQSQ
jgi:hypothetical protein